LNSPAVPATVWDVRPSSGGAYIADVLVRQRVPYVFGLCGHGVLGLLDALYDRRGEITTISVHHEAVAGFMADAYFRVARRPVATFTSCGPGSANLVVAVAAAFADSSALLAITGNVPTSQWNRGPFQETGRYFQGDFVTVLRPYVKRSFQPARADMLPLALRQAFALMTNGRPGPVHVDVPLDVFVEPVGALAAEREAAHGPEARWAPPAGDPRAIAEAARLLAEAERPVIVAGHGVELAGAEAVLRAYAEAMAIPVATTPFGKGVFDARHPLSLGATGRNGSYPANAACRNADVILALGTRFDDRATSSWLPGVTYRIPPTRLIHVDIDPNEIGRNFPTTVGVIADARLALEQLLALRVDVGGRRQPWLERIAEWRRRWEAATRPPRTSDAVPIRPERLVADLRRVVPEDGIVVADVGVHHNWIVAEYEAWAPRTLLQTWGFAAMGFGVAGPLGAKLAAPDRPVVAVCGDGGFVMNASAVLTAVEYDLPVVWVVWNNGGYAVIRDQQAGYFGAGRELATMFRDKHGRPFSADYAALARAMGARGWTVEKPADLAGQMEAAIAAAAPTVLDVRVDADARPLATGGWELPPLPPPPPTFGWNED
jgi:acetolactate synthase-1/2/3 large subunit